MISMIVSVRFKTYKAPAGKFPDSRSEVPDQVMATTFIGAYIPDDLL